MSALFVVSLTGEAVVFSPPSSSSCEDVHFSIKPDPKKKKKNRKRFIFVSWLHTGDKPAKWHTFYYIPYSGKLLIFSRRGFWYQAIDAQLYVRLVCCCCFFSTVVISVRQKEEEGQKRWRRKQQDVLLKLYKVEQVSLSVIWSQENAAAFQQNIGHGEKKERKWGQRRREEEKKKERKRTTANFQL